jgi:hypothetical protein
MMLRSAVLFVAVVLGLIVSSTHVSAQCVDQPREVALDKENSVALRSYLCSTGTDAGAAQFRVEYYRLSEGVVSLLLANSSSIKLRKTLGPAKIMPNEVSQTYADLIKQFGVVTDVPNNDFRTGDLTFTVTPADQASSRPDSAADSNNDRDNKDKTGLKKLRTLIGLWGPSSDDYPAIAEIAALRQKTISSSLSYYYSFIGHAKDLDQAYSQRSDGCEKKDLTCKLSDDIFDIKIWRPFTIGDIDNFSANAKAYNAQLLKAQKNKTDDKAYFFKPDDPASNYDRLVKFISGGELPNDFLFLVGRYQPGDGCELPGLARWKFEIVKRNVKIDAVFVENLSKQPLAIGRLFGERNANVNLRVADPAFALPASGVALDGTSGTIAPGQTAIILTRIVFLLPADRLTDFRKYRESMDALHTAFGSDGFAGNVSAYQAPDPKDYTYGPTLTVTGATVNSKRVDFAARPVSNFLELTASQEGASCPYLLSWDDGDHEWISHGKILQQGQGKANAYTQTVMFPGLRTHFRIEEREPELARLQSAKLVVELRDGSIRTFSPVQPAALGGDDVISLMWGEATDIAFAVPDTVNAQEVQQSRLQITGYYERYSDRLAEQRPLVATPLPFSVNSIERPAAASPQSPRASTAPPD